MVTKPKPSLWNRMTKPFKLSDGGLVTKDYSDSNNTIFIDKTDLVGSTGTEVYRGYLQEDYLQEMRGYLRAKTFDQMRRGDAAIKMCLNSVKNTIRSATWEVHKSEQMENQEEAQKHADFISHILFHDLNKPWSKILSEILTMCEFGHSVFEKTHKVVLNHPKFGTYNGIKSLGFRSPRTLHRWNVNEVGDLVSVTQLANGDLRKYIDIPAEYLLLFNLDQEGSNFEGISLLRPCYGPWKRKDVYLKLNAIGIEKYAVPTPMAKTPANQGPNTEEFAAMKNVLEVYTTHQSNYITFPDGWEITLHSNVYDPAKIVEAIKFENGEIANAFLANFLNLGGGSGGGSYALSNDLSDFFLGGLDYIASEISETVKKGLIKELIDMNFGPQEGYPMLKASDISDKAGKELSEILKMLIDGKIITADDKLEEHLRKRYHLPIRDELTSRQAAQPQFPGQDPMNQDLNMDPAHEIEDEKEKPKPKEIEDKKEDLKPDQKEKAKTKTLSERIHAAIQRTYDK